MFIYWGIMMSFCNHSFLFTSLGDDSSSFFVPYPIEFL
jgi:hypothetical protein